MNTNELYMKALSTHKFFWDKERRAFSADVSDLDGADLFQRIYNDACDCGFALHNPKTGNTIRFCLFEEHNVDGDITHWTFGPIYEDIRKNQKVDGLRVIVFND